MSDATQAEGLPQIFIDTFAYYYQQLLDGQTGLITEADIQPVDSLPDADALPAELVAMQTDAKHYIYIRCNKDDNDDQEMQ